MSTAAPAVPRRMLKELATLAWPIALSMISYSVMSLVDTLFVARLGSAALAGVGLGGITAFVLYCFGFGLLRGTKILVAQAIGAGRREELPNHLGAALVVALGIGLALVGIGRIVAELLPALAATVEAGENARTYLGIRLLGAPALMLFVALREYRYGLGDSRSPLLAVLVANVLNVALDFLFIVVLDMGVAGAAWATFAGHCSEAVVLFGLESRVGLSARVRMRNVRLLLALGVPLGVQLLLEIGSFASMTFIVSSLGEIDMAAHQVALQVIHFGFLPAVAISEATAVLSGRAVGADQDGEVMRVAIAAMKLAGTYALSCTLALIFFGDVIAASFTADEALRSVAVQILAVAAVFQLFDAGNLVARGALQGTGDVRFAAFLGITLGWGLTVPLAYLFGKTLELGAFGAWIGTCIQLIVASGLFWLRLARGGWKRAAARGRRLISVPATG